jgi:integrase
VRKDRTPYFSVLWRENGVQTSRSFDTPQEAEVFARVLNLNAHDSTAAERALQLAASKSPTVSDMFDRHLTLLTRANPGTVANYRHIIDNHFREQLGPIPVDKVTEDHIAAWMKKQIAAGASRKSIANRFGLLSSAFKTAVRRGWRGDNPCELVRLPNEKRGGRRATFLTRDEYDLLLEHIPERHRLLVKTLAGTGMRYSEATALTWDDLRLDLPIPVIEVNKAWKTDEHRNFYIGSTKNTPSDRDVSLPAALAAELAAQPRPHDLVFPNKFGSQLRNTTFHAHGWQGAVRAARDAGLRKRPRPHDLRHTHASWLLHAGVPVYEVSRRLGHDSIETTTRKYGHIMPEAQRVAVAALDKILG